MLTFINKYLYRCFSWWEYKNGDDYVGGLVGKKQSENKSN